MYIQRHMKRNTKKWLSMHIYFISSSAITMHVNNGMQGISSQLNSRKYQYLNDTPSQEQMPDQQLPLIARVKLTPIYHIKSKYSVSLYQPNTRIVIINDNQHQTLMQSQIRFTVKHHSVRINLSCENVRYSVSMYQLNTRMQHQQLKSTQIRATVNHHSTKNTYKIFNTIRSFSD